ncbi:plasma-membrane choline transporter-domain-containing protein [Chytriomyces sp. MP71]|nr:plasma-membrane choline transporter-domain-containing protein [Chytriomyces sp. MP71]
MTLDYNAPPPPFRAEDQVPLLDSEASQTRQPKKPLPPQNPPIIVEERTYHDRWASALFSIVMLTFVILVYLGVPRAFEPSQPSMPGGGNATRRDENPVNRGLNDVGIILSTSILAAFGYSIGYLSLLQHNAKFLIDLSFILPIVGAVLSSIICLVNNIVAGAVVWGIIALLFWWVFASLRPRLRVSAIVLATVSTILRRFSGTFVVSGFSGFIWLIFSMVWSLTSSGLKHFGDENPDVAPYVAAYMLFIFFWVTALLLDITHLTVSGTIASYFFTGVQDAESGNVILPVTNVTAMSLKRTLTTSFGSVCFSSLLSSAVQTLKAVLRSNHEQNVDENKSLFVILISSCLLCLVSILGDILDFFNKYSLTHIAIYGKNYCDAGRDTWEMFKYKGIDVIVNDCVVGKVMGMGMAFSILLCGFGGAFASCAVRRVFVPVDESQEIMILFFGISVICNMLVAAVVFNFVVKVVDSAAAAMYVCLAEDPATIQKFQPELFGMIEDVYPEVTWGMQSIAYTPSA